MRTCAPGLQVDLTGVSLEELEALLPAELVEEEELQAEEDDEWRRFLAGLWTAAPEDEGERGHVAAGAVGGRRPIRQVPYWLALC